MDCVSFTLANSPNNSALVQPARTPEAPKGRKSGYGGPSEAALGKLRLRLMRDTTASPRAPGFASTRSWAQHGRRPDFKSHKGDPASCRLSWVGGKCCESSFPHKSIAAMNPSATRSSRACAIRASTAACHLDCGTRFAISSSAMMRA